MSSAEPRFLFRLRHPGRPGHALRRLCGWMLALLLPLSASHALAQTTVTGAIVVDTRRTAADSPYLISGNMVVQNGAILTIDPGVLSTGTCKQ